MLDLSFHTAEAAVSVVASKLQMSHVEETYQSDRDQIDGNDVVEHTWYDQDQDPCDERYQGADGNGGVHH
jgi:hypothetical protein